MPDLSFQVESAETRPHSAAPTLIFKLRLTTSVPDETIQSVSLSCQIQIEATRRRYDVADHERLLDLFGKPERWSRTVRTMLWTHANVVIPPFSGTTVVDLAVPCTYDFNVAATKYFYALDDGEVPLTFLFSGSVFSAAVGGGLQVTPISWESEAAFSLPIAVWREMMELYYPNSAWLCLRADVFDQLYRYKIRLGLPTWEQALESLLARAAQEVRP